jgi:Glycosyl transferases group 1
MRPVVSAAAAVLLLAGRRRLNRRSAGGSHGVSENTEMEPSTNLADGAGLSSGRLRRQDDVDDDTEVKDHDGSVDDDHSGDVSDDECPKIGTDAASGFKSHNGSHQEITSGHHSQKSPVTGSVQQKPADLDDDNQNVDRTSRRRRTRGDSPNFSNRRTVIGTHADSHKSDVDENGDNNIDNGRAVEAFPFWANGRIITAPAFFEALRKRGLMWDTDSDDTRSDASSDNGELGMRGSALRMLIKTLRRAQHIANLQVLLESDTTGTGAEMDDDALRSTATPSTQFLRFMRNVVDGVDEFAKKGQQHVQNAFDEDMFDDDGDDEGLYDVRPLLAVSMGVTLFLLTRAPNGSYNALLDRTTDDDDFDEMRDHPVIDVLENDAHTVDWASVSDLRAGPRNIVIITTAALPWMTGTAVNPLLRAVYLAKAGHTVSLVVPWLESPEDQRKVYPKDKSFTTREQQKEVILSWAREQIPHVEINIRFYEGVYSDEFGSILPLGDLTAMFSDDVVRDVCVLEEPEHLTWHHTGARWSRIFNLSIGVVHTNYLEYAKKHGVFGPQRALFLSFLNQWVCRSYCHRVIKLSDAVQALPHSVTCNVHGVRDRFLEIGKSRRGAPFMKGAYFLGKVLWAKGYAQLVELMDEHFERTGEKLPIDFFGAGPDLAAVKERVRGSFGLSEVQIHGVVVDHASEYLQRYKVYVNPSKSDVVCTATAEALAMGKFVVCLKHPSNEFFAAFENCLIYETAEQFSAQVAFALSHEPVPLSDDDVFRLSWEAATERFYDASRIAPGSHASSASSMSPVVGQVVGLRRAPPGGRVDSALAATHKTICSTLVTPPSATAVRARYRAERRFAEEISRKARRESALADGRGDGMFRP